jgi:mono/diheme cytochrome c family protein/cytochrome c5
VTGRLPLAALIVIAACGTPAVPATPTALEGQKIFRFDTFGDEAFWTDTLRMHEVVAGAGLGGVGAGVSPATALAVGLKVDVDALPASLVTALKAGKVDLQSPATTVALLKLDAVVGVRAAVDTNGRITRFGVTCALCHSTVDNSLAPGIGRRLDGWPNRDLQPGTILSLSPALQAPAVHAVLTSWGKGKYDARWNHDGKNDPVVIPPAYGLAGTDLATYTGEGTISYWNAYVGVTQMHGQGTFVAPKIHDDIHHTPDLVTSKLPALLLYQLSLLAPAPPAGSFDSAAARRGAAVFAGAGRCASCHVPPHYTDANTRLHAPAEVGTNPLLAQRGTTGQYRTTPLRSLWQHPPYFHDGSAATLEAVVDHYVSLLSLKLKPQERTDLVQFLRSL